MSLINEVVANALEVTMFEGGSWASKFGTGSVPKFGKDQGATKDGVLAGKPAMTFDGKDKPAFGCKFGFLPGEKSPMLFKGSNEAPPQAPHDGQNR